MGGRVCKCLLKQNGIDGRGLLPAEPRVPRNTRDRSESPAARLTLGQPPSPRGTRKSQAANISDSFKKARPDSPEQNGQTKGSSVAAAKPPPAPAKAKKQAPSTDS